jgi:hypothetical protein
MSELARALLARQRKRLAAGVLGTAESAGWWEKLSGAERSAYRETVLRRIDAFYEFTLDLVSAGGDSIRSDEALALLQDIHAGQLRAERAGVVRNGTSHG